MKDEVFDYEQLVGLKELTDHCHRIPYDDLKVLIDTAIGLSLENEKLKDELKTVMQQKEELEEADYNGNYNGLSVAERSGWK